LRLRSGNSNFRAVPSPTLEGPPEESEARAPVAQEAPLAPVAERTGGTRWSAAVRYLELLDFAEVPRTRAAWFVRLVAFGVCLVFLSRRVNAASTLLLHAPAPLPLPVEMTGGAFVNIDEQTRKAIFADLATAELAERSRAIAQNTWQGHAWSREDDRGHYERVAARVAAAKYRLSLSQVYLVLDEGLREHWPSPNGEPLPPTTPPLSIRSAW
jgi:hypothetical protein